MEDRREVVGSGKAKIKNTPLFFANWSHSMTIPVYPSWLKVSLLSDQPVKVLHELNAEVCVDELQ